MLRKQLITQRSQTIKKVKNEKKGQLPVIKKYHTGCMNNQLQADNQMLKPSNIRKSPSQNSFTSFKKSLTILKFLQNQAQKMNKKITDKKDEETNQVVTKKNKSRFPKQLLANLYSHNIINYNPYLTTLKKMDESQELSKNQRKRIQRLCYIGIAKDQLQNCVTSSFNQYSRVGILIRPFMRELMQQKMKIKNDELPETIFIKINRAALSFNHKKIPKKLQFLITPKKFSKIITNVNSIIQKQYQIYKGSNTTNIPQQITNSEIVSFIMMMIVILSFLFWMPEKQSIMNFVYLGCIMMSIIVGFLLSWRECNSNINKIETSTGVTKKIQEKIEKYFIGIKNEVLEWRVGTDFYWLEVNNVKVRKRIIKEEKSKDEQNQFQ